MKSDGITLAFKDVSYSEEIAGQHEGIDTFISPLVNAAKAVATCGKSNQSRTLFRVQDISGVIPPGSMTLIVAPPGHGKSTYLKLLGHRLPVQSGGKLVYNGRSVKEAAAEGCDLRKMSQYVDQVDIHLPLLTVTETLDFAHKVSSCTYDPDRVDSTIALLGLDECKDTILGDAFVRGVSGGQKRRVTLGEMMVSDARMLFLDEYTNGLDTATSEDITRGLRQWCQETNGSIVATLQQPTPGLYSSFDKIVVLRDGHVVFDGPRDDVLPFFEAMGYRCPGDVDVCDFLVDVLSQPRLCLTRQRASGHSPTDTALVTSAGEPLVRVPGAAVSIAEMVQYYRESPLWARLQRELEPHFPTDDANTDKAVLVPLMASEADRACFGTGYVLPVSTLLHMVMERQAKLIYRDSALIIARQIQLLSMALLFSALYYQVPKSEFFLRVACGLGTAGQLAFSCFVDLPVFARATRVITKQTCANFYPSWAVVVSAAITNFPLQVLETIEFTCFIYHMSGGASGASQYLAYLAVMLAHALTMSLWFRFLSSAARNEAIAQAIAGPSTGLALIGGGLYITLAELPDFMKWLYYLSPFSWTVRALAEIEFLSPRYDELVKGERLGHVYLHNLAMDIGYEWVGYAFIYLLGLSALLLVVHSWVMIRPYHEQSIGTRRTAEEELVESELDQKGAGAVLFDQASPLADDEDDEEDKHDARARAPSVSLVRHRSSFNQNTLQTLREALPFHPTWMSFSDVKYTVQIQVDGQTKDKVLLDGVSGYAEPGKLTALMGASGAGKTTLLDVLAGRKTTGAIEGTILFNGRAPTPTDFANITGYVEQFDSLFPYDTVRETLQFAARLRLPASVSEEIKEKIVDEVLEILDLYSIEGYLIGNQNISGLSPSQLKRVNIGVELVANPSVLFLDEPTTGLDSRSAQTVMRVVRRIARSGRAVICTIHQPSAELFYLFDRLVLLGSGGHQIYFGSLGNRSCRLIKYLEAIPGVKPIPARYNPASWMLEELGVGVASIKAAEDAEANASKETQAEMIQRFKAFYLKSATARRTRSRLHALETLSGDEGADLSLSRVGHAELPSPRDRDPLRDRAESFSVLAVPLPTAASTIQQKDAPSVWYQFKLVQARSFTSYWRNPPFLFTRMKVLTALSVIMGLLYFDLDVSTGEGGIIAGMAARGMTLTSQGILCGATFLPVLLLDRHVFLRERASGLFVPELWIPTAALTEAFWTLMCALFAQVPLYWLVNMGPGGPSTVAERVGVYFQFTLAGYLGFMSFISFACVLATFLGHSIPLAGVIQGLSFSVFVQLNAVAVSYEDMPASVQWLHRTCPTSHMTEALVLPQFEGNTSPITILDGTTSYVTTVEQFLIDRSGFSYDDYWRSCGWMLLFIVVAIFLATAATRKLVVAKR